MCGPGRPDVPTSQHLYRRGDRYWYRRSIAIPGRRRFDVRLSLQTGYNGVARRLVTMLDAEALRLSSSEPSIFAILKRRAPSLPQATDDDLRLALLTHFKDVLRHYLGRHAGEEQSGDFRRRQADNLADFNLLNLLIETGTTRGNVNGLKVEEHLRGLVEAGFNIDRLTLLERAYLDRYAPNARHPVPSGERDAYFDQLGRARTPGALEQFDEMLLHSHREAVWRAELQRGRVAAVVGDETTAPVFKADKRPFERHPFIPFTDADERAAAAAQDGAGQLMPPAARHPSAMSAEIGLATEPAQASQADEQPCSAAATETSAAAPAALSAHAYKAASSGTGTPSTVLPHGVPMQPPANDDDLPPVWRTPLRGPWWAVEVDDGTKEQAGLSAGVQARGGFAVGDERPPADGCGTRAGHPALTAAALAEDGARFAACGGGAVGEQADVRVGRHGVSC